MSTEWAKQLGDLLVRLQQVREHFPGDCFHGVVYSPHRVESASQTHFPRLRISASVSNLAETYTVELPCGGTHVHYIFQQRAKQNGLLEAVRKELRGARNLLSTLPKSRLPKLRGVRSGEGNVVDDFLTWLYAYQYFGSDSCKTKFDVVTRFEFFREEPFELGQADSQLDEESWPVVGKSPFGIDEVEIPLEALNAPKPWRHCDEWGNADSLAEFKPIVATNVIQLGESKQDIRDWFKAHDADGRRLPRFIAASVNRPILAGAILCLKELVKGSTSISHRTKRKGLLPEQFDADVEVLLKALWDHHTRNKMAPGGRTNDSMGTVSVIVQELNKVDNRKNKDGKAHWNPPRVSRAFLALFLNHHVFAALHKRNPKEQAKTFYERMCKREEIKKVLLAIKTKEFGAEVDKLRAQHLGESAEQIEAPDDLDPDKI